MRIVHFSDTHLGHWSLRKIDADGHNIREQDVYRAFGVAIDKIVELRPDAVVHAGDFFDSWHPSTEAISVGLDGLARLREAGIPFVAIAGNHSTPRFRAAWHVYSLLERFGGDGAIWRGPRKVRIGDLAITGIPHSHDRAALEGAIRAAEPDAGAVNVLVLHAGLGVLPRVGTAEAASIDISPETLDATDAFDYVAMGHFHTWQPVRENASYSGSLEYLSFAEKDPKVIVEIDLTRATNDPERVVRHPIPTRLVRQLQEIDGLECDDLTEAIIENLNGIDLKGAVIRCPLVAVTQDAYRAIDHPALAAVTSECLHFELEPHFTTPAPTRPATPRDVRAFLTAETPRGLDAEEVVTRAELLLRDADTGLAA